MTQSPEIYIHNNTITKKQLFAIERYINEYVQKRSLGARAVFESATLIEVMADDKYPKTLRILVEQDVVMGGFITYGVIRIEHPGEKEEITNLNIYEKMLNVANSGYPQSLANIRAGSKYVASALSKAKHFAVSLGTNTLHSHFTVVKFYDTHADGFADTEQEDRYMKALCRHLERTKATQHTPIVVSMHPITEGGHRVYMKGGLPSHERLELVTEFSDTIHIPVEGNTTQYLFY